VNEEVRQDQRTRLAALRAKRDAGAVQKALYSLEVGARGTENLLPLIIASVEAYATLGEISDVLRKVWGEYS
jgi:methylmalonyl-CoA mutase N-terminal domain/subunit